MQISPVIVFVCGVLAGVSAELTCTIPPVNEVNGVSVSTDWMDMKQNPECIKVMEDQVKVELSAAMTYMAMGAYFSRDTVNRPGFAKMFFESASEEREHAIKIITYLLMRGELTENIIALIGDPRPDKETWTDGVEALHNALQLEAKVTRSVRDIIKKCEDGPFNDYHLVDYLTGDFLEEQYNGQRDLAGKVQTLGKMVITQGELGEFLFDKMLLKGSPM